MMKRKRTSHTLFNVLYKKLVLYALLVAMAIYATFLIFSRLVIYHDTRIMEYLTIKNLETTLSTIDKLTLKEENQIEIELIQCLKTLKAEKESSTTSLNNCSDVTQLISTPSGTVVYSNNPIFTNVSFAAYPFFYDVKSVIEEGKIASPRAFITDITDKKTFYKFIFAKSGTENIIAVGKPLSSDINLKMLLYSSIYKIISDIDIVQTIDVIYPNSIHSPLPKEIQEQNLRINQLINIKDTITKEEAFLFIPQRKTIIAIWISNIPPSLNDEIKYIPQPYLIYMTLDFSPLLKEFSIVIAIFTLGVLFFIVTSGITSYLISKHITNDITLITSALEEWRKVNKNSPEEIAQFLKHLNEEHFNFKSKIYEIEKLTETFATTIRDLLNSQQELMYKNMLLQEAYRELEEKQQGLKQAYYFFARRLAKLAEQFDNETGEHIVRVGEYSAFIAEKLGLSNEFIEDIRRFAPLHDIGKILIPQRILHKPGPLTPEEWEIMKKHTIYGWEILGGEEDNEMEMAKNIARYHHEKYDGSGYPDGLKANEIPIEARIVSLADVYDALRSARPYKKAFTHNEVVSIILKGDGRVMPHHFDPQILEVFRKYHQVFNDIYKNHS